MEEIRLSTALVDLVRGRVHKEDSTLPLTTKEVELLAYLAKRPGETISREQLLCDVWGYAPGVQSRAVDTTMRRLRSKVEADPSNPESLHTAHGAGYRFVPPPDYIPTFTHPSHAVSTLNEGTAPAPSFPLPPSPVNSVGRQAALQNLRALVEQHRLVNVLGPWGVGKSHLTLLLAHTIESANLIYVGIDDDNDAAVLSKLCDLLGLRSANTMDNSVKAVTHALSNTHETVLIFDGLNREFEAIRAAISLWLEAVPELRVVISSRDRLKHDAECVYDLGPLTPQHATELFLQEAKRVRPSFEPDDDDLSIINDLVAMLGHIPLVIKIVAGRSRMFTPEQLSIRASSSVSFLDGTASVGSSSILDSSWENLSQEEQFVLSGCTVFRGGFTMDAAEFVLAKRVGRTSVYQVLSELVDTSWLTLSETPSGMRFSILSPIRTWVESQVPRSSLVQTRHLHLEWFHDHATQRGHDIMARSNAIELAWFAVERANILAASTHALDHDDDAHAELMRILLDSDNARTATLELKTLLDEGVSPSPDANPALRSMLFSSLCKSWRVFGNTKQAEEAITLAFKTAEQANDPDVECEAHNMAIWTNWDARKHDRVIEHHRQLLRRGAEGHAAKWEMLYKFFVTYFGNRIKTAEDPLDAGREAIRLANALGYPRRQATVHQTMGNYVRDMRDDFREAIAHYSEAVKIFETIGDLRSQTYSKNSHAMALAVSGDFDSAGPMLDEIQDSYLRLQDQTALALATGNRGAIHLGADELDEAETKLWDCLNALSTQGLRRGSGYYYAYLAAAHALHGRIQKAEELFHEAASALEDFKVVGAKVFLDTMRAHISVGQARIAMREGNETQAQADMKNATQTLAKNSGSGQKGVTRFALQLLEQAIANT